MDDGNNEIGRYPGYEDLEMILLQALEQSACGKGKERHAVADQPFVEQPICTITERKGIGFPLGQVDKKTDEAMRLPRDRAVAELLGAINYLAAAILYLQTEEAEREARLSEVARERGSRCGPSGVKVMPLSVGGDIHADTRAMVADRLQREISATLKGCVTETPAPREHQGESKSTPACEAMRTGLGWTCMRCDLWNADDLRGCMWPLPTEADIPPTSEE